MEDDHSLILEREAENQIYWEQNIIDEEYFYLENVAVDDICYIVCLMLRSRNDDYEACDIELTKASVFRHPIIQASYLFKVRDIKKIVTVIFDRNNFNIETIGVQ